MDADPARGSLKLILVDNMKTLNFSKTEGKFVSLLLPEAESKMNKIVSFFNFQKLGQIKDLNADPAWLISTDWAK